MAKAYKLRVTIDTSQVTRSVLGITRGFDSVGKAAAKAASVAERAITRSSGQWATVVERNAERARAAIEKLADAQARVASGFSGAPTKNRDVGAGRSAATRSIDPAREADRAAKAQATAAARAERAATKLANTQSREADRAAKATQKAIDQELKARMKGTDASIRDFDRRVDANAKADQKEIRAEGLMAKAEPDQANTVLTVARRLGVTVRRIDYAIRSRNILPTGWVGATRVYDEEAVRLIGETVAETSSRKAPGRAVTTTPHDPAAK